MKKFLILLTIYILATSCAIPKQPTFKYIDNLEVKSLNLSKITVKANAVFNNPNDLKGKLSIEDIHVSIDNIDIGSLSPAEFNVPAKNEFTIPLEGTLSVSKIYQDNKNDLLGSVLKVMQTDSLNIAYKGIIRYHLRSFSYPYHINKQQKVKLKLR